MAGAPAANCMSFFYQMNMQEMACCAHMSHGCDMGPDHASCCQTVSDPNTATAPVTGKVIHLPAPLLPAALAATIEIAPSISQGLVTDLGYGSPPGSPPSGITVLRI